jgi:hypothetical protein
LISLIRDRIVCIRSKRSNSLPTIELSDTKVISRKEFTPASLKDLQSIPSDAYRR